MNLIGKILTGLIAFFSILFMAMALAVYATHQNWKNEVMDQQKGLKVRLDKEKKEKTVLADRLKKLEEDFDAEKKAQQTRLAALDTAKTSIEQERNKLQTEVENFFQKQREAITLSQATQQNMNEVAAEVKRLRADLKTAEGERNKSFAAMVKMTDALHQFSNDLASLKATNVTLVQDVQKYRKIFDLLGMSSNAEDYTGIAPPVECHVMSVSDTGTGLLEVNAGADEGLIKGHQLEVYRLSDSGATYLGRVEVVSTEPHKAVCKILPNFQKGTIQKGDDVTSRIK